MPAPKLALKSPYLVPFDGSFRVKKAQTAPPKDKKDKDQNNERLEGVLERLPELQRRLYADDRYSLLLVFQAMDAAGKDGTIRAVMSGVNPAGCQVFSFKAPSAEEVDHDFLWRVYRRLPERGRIGIWNRSHYEETLVVRVHPEYLEGQRLPVKVDTKKAQVALFKERFESIRNMEEHLARNGTIILKFWLNVSREEQRERFLDRIDRPEKNWKFNSGDVTEARLWDDYMAAYEDTLNSTSRPWAPWYAVPADSKAYMRATVAEIIEGTLKKLKLSYPEVDADDRAEMLRLGVELRKEAGIEEPAKAKPEEADDRADAADAAAGDGAEESSAEAAAAEEESEKGEAAEEPSEGSEGDEEAAAEDDDKDDKKKDKRKRGKKTKRKKDKKDKHKK